MGEVEAFRREKLVIGVLTGNSDLLDSLGRRLEKYFGPIDYRSEPLPFTYTDYYTVELGKPLVRCFYSFSRLIDPEELSGAKIVTNELESHSATQKKRKVNLDPGILSLHRLILASTKDNGRRIPLKNGIYGEITLIYMNGGFQDLDWTYPDYRSEEYKNIFFQIRDRYRHQLKQEYKNTRKQE